MEVNAPDNEPEPEHYRPAPGEADRHWMVCEFCGSKVYVSASKPLDAARHEAACPFR